jgi:hypothetical protein
MENIEKQKKTFKQKVWGFAKPTLIVVGCVTVGILYGGNKFGIKTKIDGAAARVKGSCKNTYKNLTSRESKTEMCTGEGCNTQAPQYNNQPRPQKNNNWNNGGGKFNNNKA